MPEPVEEIFIKIGSDITELLDGIKKGADNSEKALKKIADAGEKAKKEIEELEKAGKKVPDSLKKIAQDGDKAANALQKIQKTELNKWFIGLSAAAGAFVAVFAQQALSNIVNFFKQIGAAVVQSNAQFETFTAQFETLLGSATAAEQRLDELAQFGVETPFELPEVVEASRVLQVFGGDALATGDNLRMIGDIAAGVNQPFQDVSFWVGRMFDSMQAGRPFGEAAARLQEMGALSGVARAELEELTKAGASGAELWDKFNELVGSKFQGNMERLSKTFQGVTSNLIDFRDNLIRIGGQPLFEAIREDANQLLDIVSDEDMAESIENVATAFGEIAAVLAQAATSPFLDSLEGLEPETLNDLAASLDRAAMALSELTGQQITADFNSLIDMLTILIDAFTILTNGVNDNTKSFGLLAPAITIIKDALLNIIMPARQTVDLFRRLNETVNDLTGLELTEWSAEVAKASETEVQAAERARDAEAERLAGLAALNEEGAKTVDTTEQMGETIDKQSEAIQKMLDKLAGQMIDLTEDRQEKLEELEQEHGEKLVEIETEYINDRLELGNQLADDLAQLDEDTAKERADILEKSADDLAKLDKDTAKKRADIFEKAQDALSTLERDTDKRITKERKDFQKDERRETEDHLSEMRDLRQRFASDLEDAVKSRDARAVVDLRKRFEEEKAQREQDFSTKQAREREDQSETLAQIRQNEAERAQEIMDNRQRDLQDLMENEAEKRAEIEQARQSDLEDLAEKEAEKRAKIQEGFEKERAQLEEKHMEDLAQEQASFEERQAQLEEMLQKRLETIAKELSDEKDLNATEAQAILETLNETFGAGGDIDKLMEDFANRRKQKLVVQVGFEQNIEEAQQESRRGGGGAGRGGRGNVISGIPSFQHGGTLLANKPTLAQFGEVPELVQFTPLSQLGRQGGGGSQRMEIDLKLSGSAPPGIRADERDAIAGILINALTQAGVMGQPPGR